MAQCNYPMVKIDNKAGAVYTFPCGRCLPCVRRKKSQWAFRMDKESILYPNKFFITFTYNPANVKRSRSGRLTLDKTEWHKTIRAIRDMIREQFKKDCKKLGVKYADVKSIMPKIRYYYRGEYGGITERPHYHLLLLTNETYENITRFIQNAWTTEKGDTKGHIQLSEMTEGRVNYTLKYVAKGNQIPKYEGDDRQREFVGMSKGIGKNYITAKSIKWHKDDLTQRCYAPGKSGKKYSLPRYYKDRIYSLAELSELKGYFSQLAEDELQENLKKYGTDYYRRKAESDMAGSKKLHQQFKNTEQI